MSTTINIAPIADTFVNNYASGSNYGTATAMNVGMQRWLTGTEYHELLLRFPLSAIPINYIITSAKINLWIVNTPGSACNLYGIRNIPIANRTWTETGVTWNNKPAYDSTYPNINFPACCGSGWLTADITSYVRDMYNQGINVDIDIGFNGSSCPGYGGWTGFPTKESTDTVHRPYLQVTYDLPVSATNITATPSSCVSPCNTVVSVTWKNNSSISQTFTPGITIDGVLHTLSPLTVTAGSSITQSFNVANLGVGSHVICPQPN